MATRNRATILALLTASLGMFAPASSRAQVDVEESSLPTRLTLDSDPAAEAASVRAIYMQVVNPADKQREIQRGTAPQPETIDPRRSPNPFADRKASYDLPAIDVVGQRDSELREEDHIGPYGQPRWTARRRFPGTRVYVRPPGTVEFEFWLRPTVGDDGDTAIRTLYEISVGLPYRLQLDLYLRTDSDGDGEETRVGQQIELRWALADWNQIWGNPTLYFEYVQREAEADQIELKLLLGGEIAPRWHWGTNLVAEMETGGEREIEYQVTGGVSYSVVDSVFSVGVEAQWLFADTRGNRGDFEHTVFLGPSLQWAPFDQLHIDFAPLVGLTGADFRAFLVVGWEF